MIPDVHAVMAAQNDYGLERNLSKCEAYIIGVECERTRNGVGGAFKAATGIRRVLKLT